MDSSDFYLIQKAKEILNKKGMKTVSPNVAECSTTRYARISTGLKFIIQYNFKIEYILNGKYKYN